MRVLTSKEVKLAFLQPTKTGLEKSIMDAIAPFRIYLKENGVHNFDAQPQGPENKILLKAYFVKEESIEDSRCSLYRPLTKNGDPRVWFSGLATYANPNDILGIVAFKGSLYVINITKLDIEAVLNKAGDNPLKSLIGEILKDENIVVNELLQKLRYIAANGLVAADVKGDTAVGRTLERELGLKINSSKNPDYKGIEIKSFRNVGKNRKTLFAQVPDWSRSNLKSSAQILDAFGYPSKGCFTLRCTVSAIKPNSQGLYLRLDENTGTLVECSTNVNIPEVAVWSLEKLHERLLSKHNQTFWISAESKIIEGREWFLYKSVQHTKKPIVSQFDMLLRQGFITVDHLIKRENGKVKEKGPLFKISPNALSLLFPPSVKYSLID